MRVNYPKQIAHAGIGVGFLYLPKKQTMKKLEKTFLLFAFLTIASMPFKNVNVFAFFCLCADIFGVWWAVKTFKSI